jgi:hypothetical protein
VSRQALALAGPLEAALEENGVVVGRVMGIDSVTLDSGPAIILAENSGSREGESRRDEQFRIVFDTEDSVRLDLRSPHDQGFFEVFSSLHRSGNPAYVRTDSQESLRELLLPFRTLTSSRPEEVRQGWTFEASNRVYVLDERHPRYEEMRSILELSLSDDKPIYVTPSLSGNRIEDVRWAEGVLARKASPEPLDCGVPLAPVTLQSLNRVVGLITGAACPVRPAANQDCIPFNFPDDGCSARADKMCEIIVAEGLEPGKVWVLGDLRPRTENIPGCKAHWKLHVAATMDVEIGGGRIERRVIDPCLFPHGPVAMQELLSRLTGNISLVMCSLRTESISPDGTGVDLEYCRNSLLSRSNSRLGPPPYQC